MVSQVAEEIAKVAFVCGEGVSPVPALDTLVEEEVVAEICEFEGEFLFLPGHGRFFG